jgi:hypothetical protein
MNDPLENASRPGHFPGKSGVRTCLPALLFAVAFLAELSGALAQNYSIDWYKVAGGGGVSSNEQFTVTGTIGQPDAGGPLTGGNYSVAGGFWALFATQTPGAPLLRIFLTTTNTAIVSWPSSSTGFSLQVNTNLNTAAWGAPAETVTDDGTQKFIIVNPPTGNRFYRLFKP